MLHKVRATQELLASIQHRRVYLVGPEGMDLEAERLWFDDSLALEPYIQIQSLNLPLRMGAFSYSRSKLHPSVSVGRYCSIGLGVTFTLDEHPLDRFSTSPVFSDDSLLSLQAFARDQGMKLAGRRLAPPALTTIGHDVWIGQGVQIRSGVTIGNGAVVGAGAVVVKDVPPYAIVGGVPAKVIRYRFSDDEVERLQALAWWRFGPDILPDAASSDPAAFIGGLEVSLANNPREMRPRLLTGADLLQAATDPGT